MQRVEIEVDDGVGYLRIDGRRVERPARFEWRGLVVLAEIDAAIKAAAGIDVFHLSVSAPGRKATDAEVQEAIDEWVPNGMALVEKPSVINPFVRHFFDAGSLT